MKFLTWFWYFLLSCLSVCRAQVVPTGNIDISGQYQTYTTFGSYSLAVSTDYGKSFRIRWSSEKRIKSVASSYNGKNVVLGTGEGLWVSEDYGMNFRNSYKGCTDCVVASDGRGRYLSALNKTYLTVSSNFGKSWTVQSPVPRSSSSSFYSLPFLANDKTGATLFVALNRGSEIWSVTEYGKEWTKSLALSNLGDSSGITGLIADATCQHIYTSTGEGTIYRSRDYGKTWNIIKKTPLVYRAYMYVDYSLRTTLDGKYVVYGDLVNGSIKFPVLMISSNFGDTWSIKPMAGPSHVIFIAGGSGSLTPVVYSFSYYGMTASRDLGSTWSDEICLPGNDIVESLTFPHDICQQCPRSKYNDGSMASCERCPIGYFPNMYFYDTNSPSWKCVNDCPYPALDVNHACQGVWLNASSGVIFTTILVHALSYLYAIVVIVLRVPPQIKASWLTTSFWYKSDSGINWMAWGIILDLLFTTALPLLDVLSDLLYIITTGFHDWPILLVCSLLYLHPLVFLFKDMWTKRYLPCFYLWHIPDRVWNLYDKVDSLVKLSIMAVLCMPFFLVNLVWMLPMTCALFFLHSTRLLCVVELHNLWFYLWTGDSNTWAIDPSLIVDVAQFNNMSIRETLLESAPELILQTVNMIYMKQINFVGLFSVCVSGLSIFNAVYKYFYYCCVLKYEVNSVPNVLQHIAEVVRGPPRQVPNQYKTTIMEEEVDMVVFKQIDMQPIDEDNKITLAAEKGSAAYIYKDVAELKEFQKQSQYRFSALEAKMEELIALVSDVQK